MTRLQVSMDTLTSRIQNGLTRVVSDSVPVLNYMIQGMMKLGDSVGRVLPFFEKVASWVGVATGGGDVPGTGGIRWMRDHPGQAIQAATGQGNAAGAPKGWSDKVKGFMGSSVGHMLESVSLGAGLPSALLGTIYGIESSFGKNAGTSSAGARGALQFMPATAKQFGVTNRDSMQQESAAAAKYLNHLLKVFNGDTAKAVAAYNWGEGHVQRDINGYKDKHGVVHAGHGADWLHYAPIETQNYVAKALAGIKAGNNTVPMNVKTSHTVVVKNQTGASIATSANAMAG